MNILIVESENDQYFIEALVSSETEVICIDKYEYCSLDEKGEKLTKKLTATLTGLLTDKNRLVENGKMPKLGIILDMDNSTETERIKLINQCLQSAISNSESNLPKLKDGLKKINEFISYPIDSLIIMQIACFFTNIDGQGELETVLKEIKSKSSTFADCLYDGWLNCLKSKGKTFSNKKGESCDISDKELLKLWVDFYKRFDTLKRKDRDEKNTDWKGIMTGITKRGDSVNARGKDIFDLEHDKLNEIKTFLRLFD